MIVIGPRDVKMNATHSRSSAATYHNASGVLTSAAINVLRQNHNGIILEPAGTNLLLYSEQADNAYWTKSNSSIPTPNTILCPDNSTSSADALTENTATTEHYIQRSITVTAGETYTYSVYVKAGTRSSVRISFLNVANTVGGYASFNISTGTIIETISIAGSITASGMESLVNGWYRVWVSSSITTTDGVVKLNILNSSNLVSYLGNSSTLNIWGQQLEVGNRMSSYVQTTTATATRDADVNGYGVLSNIPVPDTGEVAWNSGTSYSSPTIVYRATTLKRYQSLSGTATVDSTPPEQSVLLVNPKWADIGYVNKMRLLDPNRNSASSYSDIITMAIKPELKANAISLIGMSNVSNIIIYVYYGNTVVQVENKDNSYVEDSVTKYYSSYIKTGLPSFNNTTIVVTLKGTGTISCASLVIGNAQLIGSSQRGINNDHINFSKIDRDIYGNAQVVRRRSIPRISLKLMADRSITNDIVNIRDALNARPAVWSGLDTETEDAYHDPLLIVGFYRRFSINIANPIVTTIDLELEEI